MIILCTDDPCFESVVPHLFGGHHVQVVPINQLVSALHFSEYCSHFIIGLPALNEEDWEVLNLAQNLPVTTFIMVRRKITEEEADRAQKLGVTGFLIDPLMKLRGNNGNDIQHLFNVLIHKDTIERISENTVFIGAYTYFHTAQHWISHAGGKTQLSDREADILKLFLRYEGRILTKEIIAEELWCGRVVIGGIPKLISRLRRKLGPAGMLINGRKQGGYIYEKR